MTISRGRFWFARACLAALLSTVTLTGESASSQASRTIKVIVSVPPGGSLDFLARLLAEQIGRTQGLTMVVESRPGAGGRIATEAVSRLPPDGASLLTVFPSLVIDPHVRKVNYDPLTSFEPICKLVDVPAVIVVNSATPYHTLAELMEAARSRPGDVTMASIGPASVHQIAIARQKRTSNIDLTYVPYPGIAPAANALLGEHVTSLLAGYANVSEVIATRRLRALATATANRIEVLRDVPTVAESGYKDFELELWFGMVAPARTPKEIVTQLAGWFSAALRAPEVKVKLANQGLFPAATCGADFAAFLRKQSEEFGSVIREANIKAE
jgi:tripartite-type tricarboxylate transporter receptor subunit TctC